MLEHPENLHWPTLLEPLAEASSALGRLSHALETSLLHQAWLWREIVLASAKISQISGYRVQSDRLMQHLAGLPLDPSEEDTGLAAARRVFLISAPLFRTRRKADFKSTLSELFEPLWRRSGDDPDESTPPAGSRSEGRATEGERLSSLLLALSRNAGQGRQPVLIDLFLGLRRQTTGRQLSPSLQRLALPLALVHAGILPKAAPALLGGRLPLGTTRSPGSWQPVTAWLARGLSSLAREASDAARRLDELGVQHRAWHACLATAGLRSHARTPLILDLLAATPVLSASLVARHLDCTPQGAGAMLKHLAALGIIVEARPRARWKIYLAGDLKMPVESGTSSQRPLACGEPLPVIDRDAIDVTLGHLITDLEQAAGRVKTRLGEERKKVPRQSG